MTSINARRFLASLLVISALAGTSAVAQESQPQADEKPLPAGKVEVSLEDLHCASCAKKVARKLYALKGVRKVVTNVKADLVTVFLVKQQAVQPTKMWQAVEAGGVKPSEIRFADQRIDAEQMAEMIRTAQQATLTR